ncbi:glycosyltransferase family protein [Aeromonas salmonicida]|uniref:hypothetical protein n=1 Tax=Aeromonas salmonicida TaxID=645 RepID=UPI001F3ED526|nr:hypothetical protein [Aeromonas salmonicida]
MVNIVNSLDDIKYDVTLLLLKREGMYLSKIPPHVKIKYLLDAEPTGLVRRGMMYSLKKRWLNAVLSKPWLANMSFPEEYDVGVSFLEGDSSLLLSHLDGPKKKIAWVHIDLEKHHTLPREIEKVAYESMDQIICVSEGSKHSVLSLYPALNDITSVIYNPIDLKKIIDGGEQKIRVGSGLNVLAVGRLLNDQKAFDVLLDAHRINISAGLNYHLTILGEGSDRSTLEAYITEHQLGDNTK